MNVHHVQHEQFGGNENPGNLILLCDIHHKAMHMQFSAYYDDSHDVLMRMNRITKEALSKIRSLLRVDDGNDLRPYLQYLSGSNTFRLGQLKTMRAALAGRDVLLVTPTGSGKSICYQLPGLLSPGPSLVISPLKALMNDQVESIWRKKIPATYINSDLSQTERRQRLKFIRQGLYKFIFVAPERFYRSTSPDTVSLYSKYAYMVVDEAHSIDLWGKSFRPSYRKLGSLRQQIGQPPVIALTATASKETQDTITSSLDMKNPTIIVTGFRRDNITIRKHITNPQPSHKRPLVGKTQYIANTIGLHPGEKMLIFVPTVKIGNQLQEELIRDYHHSIDFYHGHLGPKDKMDIANRFTGSAQPESQILISTSAFGMGINIANIRHIIHWAPALSVEDYYQQIGRAGRDGQPAYAHLLYNSTRDKGLLEFIATASTDDKQWRQEHGYSKAEADKVISNLKQKLEQMLTLIHIEDGKEWDYIIDYFGEVPFSFWEVHGKSIVDGALIALAISIVPVFMILI